MDDHFPAGFHHSSSYPTIHHPAPQPRGLPLRCMISQNVENLVFAGRNISVTHAALSSSRVMATCAILGQALGTAVAQAIHDGCTVEAVDIARLQQTLMQDDCYIPRHTRAVSVLAETASCTADVIRNGIERREENCWVGRAGDTVEYTFDRDTDVRKIRLVFDNDMNRRYHNMPCNYPLDQPEFKLPKTLIKEYRIEGIAENGEQAALHITDNRQRLVRHTVAWRIKRLRFIPLSTHGCEEFRLFGFAPS